MRECGSRQSLDHKRRCSLEKLRVHDDEWAQACFRGLEWDVLSWKMDIEEPDAAQVISIALNKRKEMAMKTGHLEIMSTLVRLCEPTPNGSVPFDPVRDNLISFTAFSWSWTHGEGEGGGGKGRSGSVHMKELESFTAVHANEKRCGNADGSLCGCGVLSCGFPENQERLLEVELEASPKQRLVPGASQHLAKIVRRFKIWDV